jgi:uncharacterized protein YjbI with pentapeptide repeats
MIKTYYEKDGLEIFKKDYFAKDINISKTKFSKIDFEGIATDISFEDCVFEKCIFGVNTRFFGVEFIRCNLEDVKFDTFFGGKSVNRNSSFSNCEIHQKKSKNCTIGADLKYCNISGRFKEYRFEGDIYQSNFSGDFNDVAFGTKVGEEASKLNGSDFSKMQNFDVRFERCNVVDCRFPHSDQFYVVDNYRGVLQELISISKSNDREYGVNSYSSMLANASSTQNVGVINLEYLELFTGPKGAPQALSTLKSHKIN